MQESPSQRFVESEPLPPKKEPFFYEQKTFRTTTKRYRKHPEDLPQSLRFAHLNPKVAAYLANKEKEAGQAPTKNGEEGDDIEEEVTEEARKSLLPDINQAFNLIKSKLDSKAERDGEDTQKYLFEETKFSAASLLSQLGNILYLFKGCKPYVPKHLEKVLCSGFIDLIEDVRYVHRDWQIAANKKEADLVAAKQRKSEQELALREQQKMENELDGPGEGDDNVKRKRSRSGMDYASEDDDVKTESKAKIRDSDSVVGPAHHDSISSAPPILAHRRGSRADRLDTQGPKPKARLDKYRTLTIDPRSSLNSASSSANFHRQRLQAVETGSVSDTPSDTKSVNLQPYTVSTIQFQLSSKTCEEKGWIVHPDIKANAEKETVLNWATQRLQIAMKQVREQHAKEKEMGYDRPIQIRFYGDTKKDAMLRIQSGNNQATGNRGQPQIPTIPRIEWKVSKKTFMCTIPDGSTTVFYPSGRTAIVSSVATTSKKGYYYLVYEDSSDGRMMACFTPQGVATVYHPNGVVRFITSSTGAMTMDTNGMLVKQVEWPPAHGKLPVSIIININSFLTFRCINHYKMELYFNNQHHKEQVKFNVGLHSGATKFKEDSTHIMSGISLTSQAAKELSKPAKQRMQQRIKAKQAQAKKPVKASVADKNKVVNPLEELQKVLDIPEKVQFDSEAEKDLLRLQRKVKNLAEEWLEHYRVHLMITSPHMRGLEDTPKGKRKRAIKSAKEGVHFIEDREKTSTPLPQPDVIKRAHSALPGPMQERVQSAASTQASVLVEGTHIKVKFDDGHPHELGGDDHSEFGVHVEQQESIARSSPYPRSINSASSRRTVSARTRSPPRYSVMSMPNMKSVTPPLNPCPVALRAEMLGEERALCKCSKHRIPYITDLEYNELIMNQAPERQVVIISVASSLYPDSSRRSDGMLEKIYSERNRNRTRPCVQCRNDPYRLLKYDIATAAFDTDHSQPMLLARHNVVPGMFLMYQGGKLLFCDHIFNGYGNARKDFQKQLMKTMRDANSGYCLPKDFRFSPLQGRHGARAAWGGEIGGAGVDRYASPGTQYEQKKTINIVKRTESASSHESMDLPLDYHIRSSLHPSSASQFIGYALSSGTPMTESQISSPTRSYSTKSTPLVPPIGMSTRYQ